MYGRSGKKCYFLPFPLYLCAVAMRGRRSNDDALYVDKFRNIRIYYITIIINITIYYTLFDDDATRPISYIKLQNETHLITASTMNFI